MNSEENIATFLNTYRKSMKVLISIMRDNRMPDKTVLIGFQILTILIDT